VSPYTDIAEKVNEDLERKSVINLK
jgi:hypothetical protein